MIHARCTGLSGPGAKTDLAALVAWRSPTPHAAPGKTVPQRGARSARRGSEMNFANPRDYSARIARPASHWERFEINGDAAARDAGASACKDHLGSFIMRFHQAVTAALFFA